MKLATFFILAFTLSVVTCQQPEGYTTIDVDEFYNDNLLQSLVDFGSQHVIDQGIETGNLPDTEYYITQIYGIYKSDLVDEKVNYAFDVMVVDLDGSAIRANFIVRHTPSNNTQEVISSAYDESYYFDDLVVDVDDSTEVPLLQGVALDEEKYDEVAPELEFLADLFFAEDDVIDHKGNVILGAPIPVSLTQFNSDPDVQNLFVYGLEDVLDEIVPQEIGVSQFHITNIYKVTKQIVNGINYLFDAEVESTSGIKIRVNFAVYTQSWTGAIEVLSYNYQLTNSDGSVITGEENFVGL